MVAYCSHIQELDYEQLPFKCRFCHSFGHFVRYWKKKVEEDVEISKGEQWTQAQKTASTKTNNRKEGKEAPTRSGAPTVGSEQEKGNKYQSMAEASKNPFEILKAT